MACRVKQPRGGEVLGRVIVRLIALPQDAIHQAASGVERDPASVLDDVLNEKVSLECALEQYGVVINRVDMAVNEEETMRIRTAASG